MKRTELESANTHSWHDECIRPARGASMSSRSENTLKFSHPAKSRTTFVRHAYRYGVALLIPALLALGCSSETSPSELCDSIDCEPGYSCVEYTGIGGNRLASCEIPCGNEPMVCPANMKCTSFADGPSYVCS